MDTMQDPTTTTAPTTPPIRKGDRVTTTGAGRTATWRRATGTVIRVAGNSVFVRWDKTTLLSEDQMDVAEVTVAV